ncbi:hypothetical protein ACFWP3_34900 [Streptomyces sp. NPDC058525]|uniref:hypothetical protein n=1 Tax=Streptomyces sp. NPDC058525 TaxID=3346538 RepID=UPI003663232E
MREWEIEPQERGWFYLKNKHHAEAGKGAYLRAFDKGTWVKGIGSCELMPVADVTFGTPQSPSPTGPSKINNARAGGKRGGKVNMQMSGGGTDLLNVQLGR